MKLLFLNLLLAHVIGDFYCQTWRSRMRIFTHGLNSVDLYVHALIVLVLSWLVIWSWSFWWAALLMGMIHLLIDASESFVERSLHVCWHNIHAINYAVWSFVIDQLLHVASIAFVAWCWLCYNDWSQFANLQTNWFVVALVLLLCWKPANMLIGLIYRSYYCPVEVQQQQFNQHYLRFGRFMGTLARWLMVFFISTKLYLGIGFIVATIAILHFGGAFGRERSEYVVIETLLSIAISIACGSLLLALNISMVPVGFFQ